jgi:hypothetical protein
VMIQMHSGYLYRDQGGKLGLIAKRGGHG